MQVRLSNLRGVGWAGISLPLAATVATAGLMTTSLHSARAVGAATQPPAQALIQTPAAPAAQVPDATSLPSASAAAKWRCKRVIARDVRVYKGPRTRTRYWGVWKRGTEFYTDRRDRPYMRYHTLLQGGLHGWVTSNPRYVRPC